MNTSPAQDLRDRLARPLARAFLPFYRRFPYTGPCSLFHVNLRGAFSPVDGFFYNRIPKSANSTVSAMLAAQSGYHRPFSGAGAKHRMLRPAYMTASQVRKLRTPEVFAFTVVRNPFVRVLSAYQDKIGQAKPQLARYASQLDTPAGQVPDFAAFCRFLDRGGLYRDAHWAPQSALLLLPLEAYDFIGRVESLDADIAEIARRIWGAGTVVTAERAGPRTDALARLRAAYCDETQEIVTRLYRADFDAFGYSAEL